MALLSNGPNGLSPQYPVGSAIVGAFFVDLFDQHGFFVMNALAAGATLFVTRALAIELFGDEGVALGAIFLLVTASYFSEYAFGLWPHMVSVLSVTLSFWLFLKACRADRPLALAALSGLALGLGLLFRVDGVLLLLVIGLLTILYATKPLAVLAGGALGLLPGFLALSYANQLKFGTWNPISYGGDHAPEDPSKYLGLIAVGSIGILLALVLRAGALRPAKWWLLPIALIAAVAVFLVPQAQIVALRIGRGIMALIVDATTIVDPRPGVKPQQDGTLIFWGLPKKAMGQSMPWIGALFVLVAWSWGQHRRAIASILIFAAIWMFPFLMRSWHGGLSLNMRYFLPLLPVFCILGAYVLRQMMDETAPKPFVYAMAGGFALSALWMLFHPTQTAGAHQILPTYVFLVICAVSLIAGLAPKRATMFALICIGIGIGQAVQIAVTDNVIAQASRSDEMLDFSEDTGKDVIYDVFVRSVLRDPNQMFALPHWRNATADPEFVTAALSDGYRVLMLSDRAEGFLASYPQFRVLEDVPIQTLPFQSIGLR
jgi:4-amino-4-deoxy-L-arabinose transferase-like glycosyltransferase